MNSQAPARASTACRGVAGMFRRGRGSRTHAFLRGGLQQPSWKLAPASVRDDVFAHQLAHDLRRGLVLRRADFLEHALLARIEQYGEAGGLAFHAERPGEGPPRWYY